MYSPAWYLARRRDDSPAIQQGRQLAALQRQLRSLSSCIDSALESMHLEDAKAEVADLDDLIDLYDSLPGRCPRFFSSLTLDIEGFEERIQVILDAQHAAERSKILSPEAA